MKNRFIAGLLLAAAAPGFVAWSPAQAPAAPAAPLTPEMQKQKDLRGPAMGESELSALMPDARERTASVNVKEAEVSPFSTGARAPEEAAAARPMTEGEKIKRALFAMRIGGVSGAPDRRRVLIGSMSVGEGDMLPRLFADQAEELKVRSISDNKVVLEFVEKEAGRQPRIIPLNFDLRARVNSLLPGEALNKIITFDAEGKVTLPPLMLGSVKESLEAAEDQDLQSVVDRRIELLNAPAVLKADEKKKP